MRIISGILSTYAISIVILTLWVRKNGGPDRVSNSLKVTQLVNGKARVHRLNPRSSAPKLLLYTPVASQFNELLELEEHLEVL